MNRQRLFYSPILLLLFILCGNALHADQVSISFDNPSSTPANCLDSWTENGIAQQLIPIPPATDCYFDYAGGDLWLFPARLHLDLSGLGTINSVQISLVDWCGSACSNAEFYQNGNTIATVSNTMIGTSETMTFMNSNADAIDAMSIQSFEGQFAEIVIDYTPNATTVCSINIPFAQPLPAAPSACMDSWTESNIGQQVIPIPPATSCFFDYSTDGLWLYPARLSLDVSNLASITSVEIDVIDYCATACTYAEFLEGTTLIATVGNTIISNQETLVFNNNGNNDIDQITVSSFEGLIKAIRIYSGDTDCSGDLLITGQTSGNNSYTACGNITSSAEISGTASYIAPQQISLEAGFTVLPGATLDAVIDTNICN